MTDAASTAGYCAMHRRPMSLAYQARGLSTKESSWQANFNAHDYMHSTAKAGIATTAAFGCGWTASRGHRSYGARPSI